MCKTPNVSGLLLRKVLVTAIQENRSSASFSDEDAENTDRLRQSPEGELLITLAVDPADAERLVFTQEFGFVWLASERSDVPEYKTDIQTRGNVFDTPPNAPTVIQAANG